MLNPTIETDQKIISMIESGEIPPRPDFVHEPDAWRRWYDEHVKCSHRSCIVPHEPGNVYCTAHKWEHRAAAKPARTARFLDLGMRGVSVAELQKMGVPAEEIAGAREEFHRTFPHVKEAIDAKRSRKARKL